jgi:hypothetical protein
MKRKLFITLSIVAMLCSAGQFFTTAAHPDAHEKNAFTPDTIQWGPPPPFVAPGAQLAVFDKDKMGSFPAGSFAYLDPDMHHYAMASGEVIVQVHGSAPLQFHYVNPADDPSKK